jgi:hypothetical protein
MSKNKNIPDKAGECTNRQHGTIHVPLTPCNKQQPAISDFIEPFGSKSIP